MEAVLIVETLASGLPDMARRVLAEMVASPAIVAFRPRRATHGGAIKSPLLSQRDGMIACFARAERPAKTGFAGFTGHPIFVTGGGVGVDGDRVLGVRLQTRCGPRRQNLAARSAVAVGDRVCRI